MSKVDTVLTDEDAHNIFTVSTALHESPIAIMRRTEKFILSKLSAKTEAQPVAVVDANDDGYWADILPDRSVKVGQLLYTATLHQQESQLLVAAEGILMHIGKGREDGVEWVCEPIHSDEIKALRSAIAASKGSAS